MSAILKLVQGTEAWHTHRSQYCNASETPAVLGVSPWVTPYQLWALKTGRTTQETTAAMQHGIDTEQSARTTYEQLTNTIMQPKVMVDGNYSASLDGINFEGDLIVEIKCPMKGQASELWKQALTGSVPEHYQWQVQHQLMVSGAKLAHFYVFDGKQGLLVEVQPKPEQWPTIQQGWAQFQQYLDTDSPPPLSERDTLIRTDQDWQQAAETYIQLKRQADDLSAQLDEAKARLVQLASHTSESGFGVSFSRYWKSGSVQYKNIPALLDVDVEQYRGQAREEVRVTVLK